MDSVNCFVSIVGPFSTPVVSMQSALSEIVRNDWRKKKKVWHKSKMPYTYFVRIITSGFGCGQVGRVGCVLHFYLDEFQDGNIVGQEDICDALRKPGRNRVQHPVPVVALQNHLIIRIQRLLA